MKTRFLCLSVLFFAVSTSTLFAQAIFEDWKLIDAKSKIEKSTALKTPDSFRLIQLIDYQKTFDRLMQAPGRFDISNGSEVMMHLPMPNGTSERFGVISTPVMEESLARKFPDIQSYTLVGLDNTHIVAKIDFGPKGFHAMVRIPGTPDVFINPYRLEDQIYMIFWKDDYPTPDFNFECWTESSSDESNGERVAGDHMFRQYRLALACTGEYAQFHGGSIPLVMAAFNTTMNRVNGVYEIDNGVTMMLVPNNDNLIYLNGATDPYTNNSGSTMLGQNQTNCDNVIGSSNYDIGHVFSTGGGGVATLNGPCNNNTKARGVTGQGAPVGDPFDIDYVAHEMGHQFGANHTQNNNCNRNGSTAMEPGSASTIMGYAGICSPNVQSNSDAYFHAVSLSEIGAFVTNGGSGASCAHVLSSANSSPTVSAGSDYTVPISTPFALTAIASDPDGDPLTYCWEQYNNEVSTQPPLTTNTVGPNFRTNIPTLSPTRIFPKDGVNTTWEVLPSVSRTMDFRITVRDFNATHGYGCSDEDDMQVTFHAGAGPFIVTAPTGGEIWTANTTETITWDVANTNVAPVNCSEVNILLSTDGGATYPYMLASAVSNDGAQQVTLPSVASTQCRIKVEADDNIFFDISDNDFEIQVPLTCTTFVSTDVPINISSSGTITIFSNLAVPITNSISRVEVLNLQGTHTYVSDLIFTLIHPNGTEIKLLSGECSNQDDFNMDISDNGVAVSCPLDQGLDYSPVDPLSGLNSLAANGNWQMKIEDQANLDGGSLNAWSLRICYSEVGGNCPDDILVFDTTPITSGTYSANQSILATVSLESNSNVTFNSSEVDLTGGFLVPLGAEFNTISGGCP